MLILFAEEQIRMLTGSFGLLMQSYGERKARRIRQRLDELDAANNLEDVRTLPPMHCQQVKEQLSFITICTLQPARMLLKVEDTSCFDGNELNWRSVTTVKIISLDENTYE